MECVTLIERISNWLEKKKKNANKHAKSSRVAEAGVLARNHYAAV